MPEERWDYNTTIKFIRLLHARPIIWKKNLKEFVDPTDRDAAIADIAERMNTLPARIKDRIKRMKESCLQEEIRMQTFNDHMPRYPYFHQFRFVLKAEHEDKIIKREIEDSELSELDEILWVDDINKKETYDETDMIKPEKPDEINCDEFTALGKSIANELRRLEKSKEEQTKLKNDITLAMLEAIENVAKQKNK